MSKRWQKNNYIEDKIKRKLKRLTKSRCVFSYSHLEPTNADLKFNVARFVPYIQVQLNNSSFTFDALSEISELFKTKQINISSEYSEGCPTCGGSTDQRITIYNPVLTDE